MKHQKESPNLEVCASKFLDLSTVNIIIITKVRLRQYTVLTFTWPVNCQPNTKTGLIK